MTWSYDETDLVKTTTSGKVNLVRLLVGDTDSTDQLVTNEEIIFSLSETGDNIYFAAAWCADTISAQFSRRVTTRLDGALEAEYSDLAKQYKLLAGRLTEQGLKYSGTGLGVAAGGISNAAIDAARDLTDRPKSKFRFGQFNNLSDNEEYIPDNV